MCIYMCIYIYIHGKRGGNFPDTSQTHATTLRTKAVGTRTEYCTHVPLLARQQHSNARQEHGLAWAWQVRLETRRAKCTCIATPRPMLGMPAAREQARTQKHVTRLFVQSVVWFVVCVGPCNISTSVWHWMWFVLVRRGMFQGDHLVNQGFAGASPYMVLCRMYIPNPEHNHCHTARQRQERNSETAKSRQ